MTRGTGEVNDGYRVREQTSNESTFSPADEVPEGHSERVPLPPHPDVLSQPQVRDLNGPRCDS